MSTEPPIIIIKKKGGHGGHHGGAWKVAYADFVTAMMSLFIVLWLMSSTSKATKEEIAGYFRDPNGTSTKHGATKQGKEDSIPAKKLDMALLKDRLQKAIQQVDSLKKLKGQIEMTVTDEGLRIELMEDNKGTFFESGSAKPTPVLVTILELLSSQLGGLSNRISVEGHTDAQQYSSEKLYGNWELSADRANMARRIMQANGIGAAQISQVRGFADQRLRKPEHPLDPSNRRISLIVLSDDPRDMSLLKGAAPAAPAASPAVPSPSSASQPGAHKPNPAPVAAAPVSAPSPKAKS